MYPHGSSASCYEAVKAPPVRTETKNENQYNVDPIAVYYSIPYSIENTNTFYNVYK